MRPTKRKMMKVALVASATIAALSGQASASVVVIGFDNLDTSLPFNGNGAVFTNYSEDGFDVLGVNTAQYTFIDPASSTFNSFNVIGQNGLYNTNPVSGFDIKSTTPSQLFSFGGFETVGASGISAQGYKNGQLVYSNSNSLSSTGIQQNQGYAGLIDMLSLRFTAGAGDIDGYTHADNIALNIGSVTGAVPEPATWAMMIVGFGAVGAAMRRRRATYRPTYHSAHHLAFSL